MYINILVWRACFSTEDDMVICARYYEETGTNWDKAIVLYHKSGQVGKALELAFEHQQFTALQHITSNLDSRSVACLNLSSFT